MRHSYYTENRPTSRYPRKWKKVLAFFLTKKNISATPAIIFTQKIRKINSKKKVHFHLKKNLLFFNFETP